MPCISPPRNILLISGVVLSHLLVLLGLLSIPLGSEKSPTQEVLMVSLMGDRAKSSVMKKSIVTPQIISFSGKENQSLMEAGGISSLIGIEGASRLTEGTARQAIHSPKPHYPLASRQLREQGLVIVKLCVNEQGVVGEAGISKSSGFQNLDHSALKTLVQWRFSEISSSSSGLFPQCFQTPIQFTLEG